MYPSTRPGKEENGQHRRPTLDERIERARKKLADKEAERDELAAALRSLKASKANKDRKAKATERTRTLIQMGLHFEEVLLEQSPNFINQIAENLRGDIKNLKTELLEEKDPKSKKKKTKIITDKEITLIRLRQLEDQLVQEEQDAQ